MSLSALRIEGGGLRRTSAQLRGSDFGPAEGLIGSGALVSEVEIAAIYDELARARLNSPSGSRRRVDSLVFPGGRIIDTLPNGQQIYAEGSIDGVVLNISAAEITRNSLQLALALALTGCANLIVPQAGETAQPSPENPTATVVPLLPPETTTPTLDISPTPDLRIPLLTADRVRSYLDVPLPDAASAISGRPYIANVFSEKYLREAFQSPDTPPETLQLFAGLLAQITVMRAAPGVGEQCSPDSLVAWNGRFEDYFRAMPLCITPDGRSMMWLEGEDGRLSAHASAAVGVDLSTYRWVAQPLPEGVTADQLTVVVDGGALVPAVATGQRGGVSRAFSSEAKAWVDGSSTVAATATIAPTVTPEPTATVAPSPDTKVELPAWFGGISIDFESKNWGKGVFTEGKAGERVLLDELLKVLAAQNGVSVEALTQRLETNSTLTITIPEPQPQTVGWIKPLAQPVDHKVDLGKGIIIRKSDTLVGPLIQTGTVWGAQKIEQNYALGVDNNGALVITIPSSFADRMETFFATFTEVPEDERERRYIGMMSFMLVYALEPLGHVQELKGSPEPVMPGNALAHSFFTKVWNHPSTHPWPVPTVMDGSAFFVIDETKNNDYVFSVLSLR